VVVLLAVGGFLFWLYRLGTSERVSGGEVEGLVDLGIEGIEDPGAEDFGTLEDHPVS
jgi:hypothetical protein